MEKEKEKENDWDLFIDLEEGPNIISNKSNILVDNKIIEYLPHWNKLTIKRKIYYHYTIENCNNDACENDFFKNKYIKEKNKYLDKMMNYRLKTK